MLCCWTASSVDGKATVVQRVVLPRSPISGKEFDPLSVHAPPPAVDEHTQNKVLSSFGLMADGQFKIATMDHSIYLYINLNSAPSR